MFNQVRLADSEKDFFRFLYRKHPRDELKEYRFTRIVFGINSSPFQSIMTIQALCHEINDEYPEAANIIRKLLYVDDFIYSNDEILKLQQVIKDANALFEKGGFKLAKFHTNCKEIVKEVPLSKLHPSIQHYKDEELPKESIFKTLGIEFDGMRDEFAFNLPKLIEGWHDPEKATKRTILSDTAKIYDPMGMLSPLVTTLKIFIQDLWVKKLDWDDQLTPDLKKTWRKIFAEFQASAEKIVFNRYLFSENENTAKQKMLKKGLKSSQALYEMVPHGGATVQPPENGVIDHREIAELEIKSNATMTCKNSNERLKQELISGIVSQGKIANLENSNTYLCKSKYCVTEPKIDSLEPVNTSLKSEILKHSSKKEKKDGISLPSEEEVSKFNDGKMTPPEQEIFLKDEFETKNVDLLPFDEIGALEIPSNGTENNLTPFEEEGSYQVESFHKESNLKVFETKIDTEEVLNFKVDLRDDTKFLQAENKEIAEQVTRNKKIDLTLHGFCDASERSYAAVIYARYVIKGKVETSLILAKSRLTPMKAVTMPRLELQSAVLLSKAMTYVRQIIKVESKDCYLYGDSEIVQAWLTKHPQTLKVYCANRVATIQKETEGCTWLHVSGTKNPADLNSRGCFPEDFNHRKLWFCRPEFLQQDFQFHPKKKTFSTKEEVKPICVNFTTVHGDSHGSALSLLRGANGKLVRNDLARLLAVFERVRQAANKFKKIEKFFSQRNALRELLLCEQKEFFNLEKLENLKAPTTLCGE